MKRSFCKIMLFIITINFFLAILVSCAFSQNNNQSLSNLSLKHESKNVTSKKVVKKKITTIDMLKIMSKKYDNKKELGYKYDKKTSTLFVFGKGKMKYKNEAPWMKITKKPPFCLPENIVVCKGLTSISDRAFSDDIDGNSGLGRNGLFMVKNVVIANTVKKIGKYAFYNCDALETVIIPNSVKIIGRSAFEDCDKLNNVTIPGNVKSISKNMFLVCREMKKITIEHGVKEIGEDAFYGTKLNSIVLPETVERIKRGAFKYTNFKYIKLPSSIVEIGEEALGYNFEEKDNYRIKGFTIKGYKGTAAEKYAKKNGFKFVALG